MTNEAGNGWASNPYTIPGAIIADKFVVERVLGQGGFGIVVSAVHQQLEERVAIKFLLPEAAEKLEIRDRFIREARASAKIRSEHVVKVSDVGTLPGNIPFMVMEYLVGSDLEGIVEKNGPLPFGEAVDWILQACEALAEAHALGMVHRDIKPQNLFYTTRADGSVLIKVLDFGISKQALGGPDKGLTGSNAVLGSPQYMPPEQVRSAKNTDARSDIWALGTTLYYLVSGQFPFACDDGIAALLSAILFEPPTALRQWKPELPEAFEQAVMRCLAKDPALRYQNIADFASAFAKFASPSARTSAERISNVLSRSDKGAPNLAGNDPKDANPSTTSAGLAKTVPQSDASSAAAANSLGHDGSEIRKKNAPKTLLIGLGGLALIGVVGAIGVYTFSHAGEQAAAVVEPAFVPSSADAKEIPSTPSASNSTQSVSPSSSASVSVTGTSAPQGSSPVSSPVQPKKPSTEVQKTQKQGPPNNPFGAGRQ